MFTAASTPTYAAWRPHRVRAWLHAQADCMHASVEEQYADAVVHGMIQAGHDDPCALNQLFYAHLVDLATRDRVVREMQAWTEWQCASTRAPLPHEPLWEHIVCALHDADASSDVVEFTLDGLTQDAVGGFATWLDRSCAALTEHAYTSAEQARVARMSSAVRALQWYVETSHTRATLHAPGARESACVGGKNNRCR